MPRQLIVTIIGDDASLQRALGSAAAATDTFAGRMSAAGEKITSVGKTLTTHLTLPLLAVGAIAGKTAVDFQNSMELLHTQAGVGQAAVEGLSKSVLALAGPTATAPDELSAGLYHLASQGLRGADALNALKASAEGAKLGQADLEDVTNALGAVIVSKIDGVKSYGQAMGELNKIVGAGDMRMQDLADAMGTGLPAAAKIAGVSLDQIGGALATFGDNNIRGAKAGTLLNSTLRIMSAPSAAAAKALAGVGIGADQLGNALRSGGLTDAIGILKQKMDEAGLTATQQGIVLTRAFGGRQATGVKILLDEFDRLKTKVREVGAGGGQFASDWASYTKTTAYHLASMGAQMQATGVTIGTILLPVVAEIADVIGRLAARFQALSPTVQRIILIFAGVAAAIGPVVAIIGSLVTAIGAIVGLSAAAAIFIGLAAAIGVVAGAIALAVLKPKLLEDALEKMGLSAKQAGEVVADLQDVFHVVADAVEALVQVVRDNWAQISATVAVAVDIIKTTVADGIAGMEAFWAEFGSRLIQVMRTDWELIKATIKNALEVIKGIFDVIDGLIHGNWHQFWDGIKEIAGGTLKEIGALLQAAVSLLGDAAKLIGTAIYKGIVQPLEQLAGYVLAEIKKGINSAIISVVGWVGGVAKAIGAALVAGIENGIKGGASGIADKLKGAVTGALNDAKHLFGIGSPSRVFADEIGKPLAQGISTGYLEEIAGFSGLMSSSLRGALGSAKGASRAPALAGSGGPGGMNVSIQNLHLHGIQNVKQLDAELKRLNRASHQRAGSRR